MLTAGDIYRSKRTNIRYELNETKTGLWYLKAIDAITNKNYTTTPVPDRVMRMNLLWYQQEQRVVV